MLLLLFGTDTYRGSAAIYGMSAAIPDRSLIDRIARGYIDTMYLTDK
jgi:hypothetical protein